MSRHQRVAKLVEQAYTTSPLEIAHWMWEYHVPVVAHHTEHLAQRLHAQADIAVAGAWLHDFGDAFVSRFDSEHEVITLQKGSAVLQQAGYTSHEVTEIFEHVINPHSCYPGNEPITLEGKIMATSDALAHLTTDFYPQFCWKHFPEGKDYRGFLEWVKEKLERDFHAKIFFPEVQKAVRQRYEALKETFVHSGL
jgi:HD superfamily phosphodiesterase